MGGVHIVTSTLALRETKDVYILGESRKLKSEERIRIFIFNSALHVWKRKYIRGTLQSLIKRLAILREPKPPRHINVVKS